MYQPIIICIGFRYLFRKKINKIDQCITYFSIITMALGVMALIIVLSIMNGFEKELEKKLLNFTPHVLLTSNIGSMKCEEKEKSYLLKKVKGIQTITEIVISNVILQSKKSISIGTMIGINPTYFNSLEKFIIYGSIVQLAPKTYHTIISATLAKQLKVKIGDNIRLILPNITKITPVGNIPAQRLFKVQGIYITNTDIDNYQLLVNQEDGARLMHYPANHVTGWRLWLQKPLEIERFDTKKIPNKIIKKDWREHQGNIFAAIKMEKNMMKLLLSSIILISGFNIIGFSTLLISEKKKEIAILKTQGLNNKNIILLFTIQGTFIGILGTILGLLFGYILTKKINWLILNCTFFENSTILPTYIDVYQIIAIIIISISISFLSTLYPAKIATTINPSKTLRYE